VHPTVEVTVNRANSPVVIGGANQKNKMIFRPEKDDSAATLWTLRLVGFSGLRSSLHF
jgi:hypothetical protein